MINQKYAEKTFDVIGVFEIKCEVLTSNNSVITFKTQLFRQSFQVHYSSEISLPVTAFQKEKTLAKGLFSYSGVNF